MGVRDEEVPPPAVRAGPNFRWADLHGESLLDAIVGWPVT